MSEVGRELLREMVAESAALSVNSISELLELGLKGVLGILQPIFGSGAVEAAEERIRKDYS